MSNKGPNLVVLDADPKLCAQAYCDADLQDLPYHYAICLEHAHIQAAGGPVSSKHVLTKWALGDNNWWWLANLVRAMLDEQEYRFGGEYCEDTAMTLNTLIHPDDDGPRISVPRFLQLIPEKIPGNAVEAYRKWYHTQASPSWTRRGAPTWWQGSEQSILNF